MRMVYGVIMTKKHMLFIRIIIINKNALYSHTKSTNITNK
jgi:hypothetical protein